MWQVVYENNLPRCYQDTRQIRRVATVTATVDTRQIEAFFVVWKAGQKKKKGMSRDSIRKPQSYAKQQ
jgi:hypothetical protein